MWDWTGFVKLTLALPAIPLLAGPGAITAMIIATHESPGLLYDFALPGPAAVIAGAVWGTLGAAARILRRLGRTGMNIIARSIGLIIAAIAVGNMYRGQIGLFPDLVS